jgi:hypothetical protein
MSEKNNYATQGSEWENWRMAKHDQQLGEEAQYQFLKDEMQQPEQATTDELVFLFKAASTAINTYLRRYNGS